MLSLTRTATRPIELVLFYFCATLAAIVRVLPAQTIPTPAEFGSDAAIEMDRIIQSQMNALHVPGLILLIVQDGRVALSKGYGLANIENKQPMNPARTILSVSSTSKSFTATAVMQLVEKGTLSLDQDVAVYLNDFRVKSNHGQPITLRQLLTHTAGFDERNIGTSARSAAQIVPLHHYLQRRLPPSLIVPGKLAVYSNH
jgi:CubicO group peptidase (beta-lactamase class C family)